ncbi:hypothetical protein ACFE04_022394 [Oxalis oulophora]
MGSSNGTNLFSAANFGSWMIFDIPTGISKGPVGAAAAFTFSLISRLIRTKEQSGQHITTDILALLSNIKNCVDKVGPTEELTVLVQTYAKRCLGSVWLSVDELCECYIGTRIELEILIPTVDSSITQELTVLVQTYAKRCLESVWLSVDELCECYIGTRIELEILIPTVDSSDNARLETMLRTLRKDSKRQRSSYRSTTRLLAFYQYAQHQFLLLNMLVVAHIEAARLLSFYQYAHHQFLVLNMLAVALACAQKFTLLRTYSVYVLVLLLMAHLNKQRAISSGSQGNDRHAYVKGGRGNDRTLMSKEEESLFALQVDAF